MKTITVRELNRSTAKVLTAVEHGETFELIRNGKAVAYMTRQLPPADQKPDWKAHFEWLRKQPKPKVASAIEELEEDRRRQRRREEAMG